MSVSVKAAHLSQPSSSRFDATWYRTSFGAEERLVGVSRSKRTSKGSSALASVKPKGSSSRAPLLVQGRRSSPVELGVDPIPNEGSGQTMTPLSDLNKVDLRLEQSTIRTCLDSQTSLRGTKQQKITTLPLAPRPRRLPTPDLPDISCSLFCECCNSFGTNPKRMKQMDKV
ncbi:MAG: hypothetical protein M1812_004968 [Candelaria pacifica]|nr:MAG: hypothetical protein M1812_004968 [Candelaria pacifica]